MDRNVRRTGVACGGGRNPGRSCIRFTRGSGSRKSVLPKSLEAEAVGYTLAQWDALNRCLGDGDLPIDNNLTRWRKRIEETAAEKSSSITRASLEIGSVKSSCHRKVNVATTAHGKVNSFQTEFSHPTQTSHVADSSDPTRQ